MTKYSNQANVAAAFQTVATKHLVDRIKHALVDSDLSTLVGEK